MSDDGIAVGMLNGELCIECGVTFGPHDAPPGHPRKCSDCQGEPTLRRRRRQRHNYAAKVDKLRGQLKSILAMPEADDAALLERVRELAARAGEE